jgi:excisionase family DNA binding protein
MENEIERTGMIRNRSRARSDAGSQAGVTSNERLLRLLSASPEQQAAIDRILEGRLAPPPEPPKGPLLMHVKDAAALLGVHRATIWRLVKAGRLGTVELLGSLRIRRADVEALAGGHQAQDHHAAAKGVAK